MLKLPRFPLDRTPDSVGLTYENVSFPSRSDGIILKGWYLPGKSNLTLILANGGAQNRVDEETGTLEISYELVEKGYNLMLFDFRGRGESEGEGYHLIHSEKDLGGAVDYLRERYPSGDIGLMGFSTGAVASILVASREKITAVVSDTCFSSVGHSLANKLAIESGIPRIITRIIAPVLFLIARVLYGYRKVDPVNRVAGISCPVLFIQGDSDDLVPVSDAHKLYRASANVLDELWIVPDAGHTKSYRTKPTAFIEKVTAFLERAEAEQGK